MEQNSFNFIKFAKFILVGIMNTAISYTVYVILLQFGISFAIAAAIGQIAGIINSYFMNKYFTFKSNKKSIGEVFRFILVYTFQYILGVLFIYLMPLSYELAGLIILPINPIISFLGHKYFTFKEVNEKI